MGEKAKLSDILQNVKTSLKKAIKEGVTGVTYMYVNGAKILSLSIENIDDDTVVVEGKDNTNAENNVSTENQKAGK